MVHHTLFQTTYQAELQQAQLLQTHACQIQPQTQMTNPRCVNHMQQALAHFHGVAETERMQQEGQVQVKCKLTAIDADC